jgi:hypothetical protein
MNVFPVVVDKWEIECCGSRFSIGDRVTWRLVHAPEAKVPGELFVTLDASGRKPVRVALVATWHGGGPEPTAAPVTGYVRRIRVFSQRMEITEGRPRRRLPVVSSTELVDTTECPLEFDDDGDRSERGVVVDLQLAADEEAKIRRAGSG